MKNYYTTHFIEYEHLNTVSSTELEVLPFLKGKKWDQTALNYVHSLRPSGIRVTTGVYKADARLWRVTVLIDTQNIIKKVIQEVQVGCIGYEDGYDMDYKYRK